MKIIRPMICQKLRAGLAKLNSSTTTPFHNIFPTKAIITNAITNATRAATVSAYTSRFTVGFVSANASTAARDAAPKQDIFYYYRVFSKITEASNEFLSGGRINRNAAKVPRSRNFHNTAERWVAQYKIQMGIVSPNPAKSSMFQRRQSNRVLEVHRTEAPFAKEIQIRIGCGHFQSTLIVLFALDMLPQLPFHYLQGHRRLIVPVSLRAPLERL